MTTRRIPSPSTRARHAVVRPSLTLFEAKQQLMIIRAEEDALESLLDTPVLEITLRTGTEQMTLAVAKATGFSVVHELLLDAIQRREQAQQCYQALTSAPLLTPAPINSVSLSTPKRA